MISHERVLAVVARAYGISVDRLVMSRGRTGPLWRARALAMYLIRRHCLVSLPKIGRLFGGKDHSTAWHACERIEAVRAHDFPVNAKIDALERQIMESAQ